MIDTGGTKSPGTRIVSSLTSSFKSSSRQKKAPWGNRFVRDHNDLIYDAHPHSISSRLNHNTKLDAQKTPEVVQNSAAKKYEYSPVKQRQLMMTSQSQRSLRKGLNVDNYLASVQEMQKMKRSNQETAATSSKRTRFLEGRDNPEVQAFNDYDLQKKAKGTKRNFLQENIQQLVEYKVQSKQQPVNLLGLSRYEFDATIHGKLISKSNHHLDFQRSKTNKINNVHKHWYNHSKDIEKSQQAIQRQQAYIYFRKADSLRKVHSFKSYSAHQLFHRTRRMMDDNGCGNGGLHYQYYDITSPEKYELTHQRIVKDNVNYRVMTARPHLPTKPGTNLQYQVDNVNTMATSNKKRPILELSLSPRKLTFSRQVISPSRGCYR